MRTEDVQLDIKGIFERKKVPHCSYDVARMRYLCKQFVEFILELEKNEQTQNQRDLPMEKRSEGIKTA